MNPTWEQLYRSRRKFCSRTENARHAHFFGSPLAPLWQTQLVPVHATLRELHRFARWHDPEPESDGLLHPPERRTRINRLYQHAAVWARPWLDMPGGPYGVRATCAGQDVFEAAWAHYDAGYLESLPRNDEGAAMTQAYAPSGYYSAAFNAVDKAIKRATTRKGDSAAAVQAAEEWIFLIAPEAPAELRAHPALCAVFDPNLTPSPDGIAVAWDVLDGLGLVEPMKDAVIARDGVRPDGSEAPVWARRTALLRCFARRSPRWM